MPAQKIGTFLGRVEFSMLTENARRIVELQKRYVRCIPRELARWSRVASYRSGTLVVTADNAAAAAKLRQITPRMLKKLNEEQPRITAIRIRVQPTNPVQPRPSSHHRDLPAAALREFRALEGQVGDPELKNALRNLVRRHARRARRDS